MKQRDILLILISAFIIVIVWIVFNVIHSSVTSTIPENLAIQIIPISSQFDIKTLEKLKTRQKVSPLYSTQNPTQITPQPTIQIPTQSTESATPTVLPTQEIQASEGGILAP